MPFPLSAALWRLLAEPPYKHPLFRRMAVPRIGPDWLVALSRLLRPVVPVLYLVLTFFICMFVVSNSTVLWFLLAFAAVLVLDGTAYGIGWALGIAGAWAAEREREAHVLLFMLPDGASGTMWALAGGIMHREYAFSARLQRHRRLLSSAAVAFLIMVVATVLVRRMLSVEIVVSTVTVLGLLAGSYADYAQSLVLGALIGVWAGEHTRRRFDAEVWSALVYLALQVGFYALAVVTTFGVIAPQFVRADAADVQRTLILLLLSVAILLASREVVIGVLWRGLVRRLNISTASAGIS